MNAQLEMVGMLAALVQFLIVAAVLIRRSHRVQAEQLADLGEQQNALRAERECEAWVRAKVACVNAQGAL